MKQISLVPRSLKSVLSLKGLTGLNMSKMKFRDKCHMERDSPFMKIGDCVAERIYLVIFIE